MSPDQTPPLSRRLRSLRMQRPKLRRHAPRCLRLPYCRLCSDWLCQLCWCLWHRQPSISRKRIMLAFSAPMRWPARHWSFRFMLMVMMSNAGFGSGVASSVARAVGAGRSADDVLFHAMVLAILIGALFTLGSIAGGASLYGMLGARGDALTAAVDYSDYLFAGAIPVWIVNLQAAALRGSGNVRVPAMVTLIGAIVTIPLSPLLIFGLGPIPGLGIGGAGLALACITRLQWSSCCIICAPGQRRSDLSCPA